jgi:hypothetical protein
VRQFILPQTAHPERELLAAAHRFLLLQTVHLEKDTFRLHQRVDPMEKVNCRDRQEIEGQKNVSESSHIVLYDSDSVSSSGSVASGSDSVESVSGSAVSGSGSVDSGSVASGSGSVFSGSASAIGSPKACQKIPFFFYIEELNNGFAATGNQDSFDNVPFYSTTSGEPLGFYSDSATSLANEECVGSGTFSFGLAAPLFQSQINIQFTCKGEFNSITGGNGDFGCASGYEYNTFQDENVIEYEFNICSDLCPYTK